VKDASLYCPPGIEGTVVDCKVFSRKGAELDERSKLILEAQEERLHRNLEDEKRILNDERAKRLTDLLEGKELLADLHDEKTNKKLLSKGVPIFRAT
jgi:DNA-directed RNA polymerase subunit beta